MQLKIMTFNLRTSRATGDGINWFPHRKPYILNVINKHAPHLIGFQEVDDCILSFLRESMLDTYEIVACGRDSTLRGECVAIAYRRDTFVCIKSETFWLSPTPDVIASSYGGDQSVCPRVTTWALLKANDIDEPFVFANTHFDHEGRMARLRSAEQMSAFFDGIKYPAFFTGDFNATPNQPTIKKLTEILTDLSADIGPTFHNYGKTDYTPVKIDYIFTTLTAPKYSTELITDGPFDGVFPSDHYPVVTTIEYK